MDRDASARSIINPYGKRLTRDMLPPARTVRWVARRKAQVVSAIRGGLISREEARDLYKISDEELVSWEKSLDDQGHSRPGGTSIERYVRIASTRQTGRRSA